MFVNAVRAKNGFRVLRHWSVRFQTNQAAATFQGETTQLLNTYNDDIKAGGVVPIFRRALLFPSRVAIHDELGKYTYGDIFEAAQKLADTIASDLHGETKTTVAYMCGNDSSHVIAQWAIWMSGNIAVPLSPLHPPAMLEYYVTDSAARLILCSAQYSELLDPVASDSNSKLTILSPQRKRGQTELAEDVENEVLEDDSSKYFSQHVASSGKDAQFYAGSDALILYTSGTTSKPKGVVWSHDAWNLQTGALRDAWKLSAGDCTLHALPLNHVHGQLNALSANLAVGACVRMLPSFNAAEVWRHLLGVSSSSKDFNEGAPSCPTILHGVPAMYAKLVAEHSRSFASQRTAEYARATLEQKVRLMCVGSAPMPPTLFDEWERISGHRLLERYGMTEVGMALSNPLEPAGRRCGTVGAPLPAISVRVVESGTQKPLVTCQAAVPSREISLEKLGLENGSEIQDLFSESQMKSETWGSHVQVSRHVEGSKHEDGVQGELLIKGPSIFSRYWNRVTDDFAQDGWFKTGDTVSYSEDGYFKIMGRTSVDIIKTGGYKVSAIQIEATLVEHPDISDAGVIGLPDETWGEAVVAVVSQKPETEPLTLPALRKWARDKLAPYQIPTALNIVEELPRNQMGKLDKKLLVKMLTKKKNDQ